MDKRLLVVLIAILAIVAIYFNTQNLQQSKPITELFTKSTPYLIETMITKMNAVSCEPQTYVQTENIVCTPCSSFSVCFETSVVNHTDGPKLTFLGRYYLSGDYDILTEANLRTLGFAKFMNCDNSLLCDNGVSGKLHDKNLTFTFSNKPNAIFTLKSFNSDCQFKNASDPEILTFECTRQFEGLVIRDSVVVPFK